MNHHHFLPVFLTLIASYIGLHFYAAAWLTRSFGLSAPAASWLRAALLAAAFFSPLTMYLRRHWHNTALETLYTAGYAWMGIIMVAAFIFACSDLALAAARRTPGLIAPAGISRLTLCALAAALAWAFYGGLRTPDVREITIPVKGLSAALEGFKIAQVSDMHLDSSWKLRQFGGLVERINSARPDLVLVTGDLIDPGLSCRDGFSALALKIKSPQGIFGAPGNHEYYYGIDKSADCYKAFGIKLLRNEARDLKDLRLIGLGDIHTENLSEAEVKQLLEKHKTTKFTIILSHQPLYYSLIAETGNYLTLSGHTHRGQIFPFHIFTRSFYKYFYGLYRLKDSVFYVTSGAGAWGPPMRWLAPAEIPIFKLVRKN